MDLRECIGLKKEKKGLSEIQRYAALYFLCALALVLGLYYFMASGLKDGAAWFQALGSVVALLVGLATLIIQRSYEIRMRDEDKREREMGFANRLLHLAHEVDLRLVAMSQKYKPISKPSCERAHLYWQDVQARLNDNHRDDGSGVRLSLVSELRWAIVSLRRDVDASLERGQSLADAVRSSSEVAQGVIQQIKIHHSKQAGDG